MQIITETQRLIIREFLPEEQSLFLNHFEDEELLRFIPKRTKEDRIAIFNQTIIVYDNTMATRIWGIFNKTDNDFAGTCLLRPFNGSKTETELGYSIERKYWNQGIGTEMAIAMTEYAFATMVIKKVVAVTIPENIGSKRVLLKAGFEQGEDIIRDGVKLAHFEKGR